MFRPGREVGSAQWDKTVVRPIRMAKKAVEAGTLAALTVGAVCGARWLGSRPDPRLEQFLQGPSAVERLLAQSEREGNGKAGESKTPLVAQAEAFARHLNPPAPPRRTPPVLC